MNGGNILVYSGGELTFGIEAYYSPPDDSLVGAFVKSDYCYAGARGSWKLGLPNNRGLWYYSLLANQADTSAGGGGVLNGTWTGTVSSGSGSDANIKHDITDIDSKYDILFDNLRPVCFKYNDGTSGRVHTGFIAQEVKAAIENAGLTTQDFAAYYTYRKQIGEQNFELTCALRYGEFVALNTREIQKLKARITELENKLNAKV